MDDASPEQHGKLFAEKLSELERQQELLARRMEKLRCHIQAVKTLTSRKQPGALSFGGVLVEQRYIIMFARGRLPCAMLPGFYR